MKASERESLRNEIAILQLVNHPNLIHLKNVFENRNELHIVMQLMEGGDLFSRVAKKRRLNEKTTKNIIHTLLKATQYLHEYGIVHRDLK